MREYVEKRSIIRNGSAAVDVVNVSFSKQHNQTAITFSFTKNFIDHFMKCDHVKVSFDTEEKKIYFERCEYGDDSGWKIYPSKTSTRMYVKFRADKITFWQKFIGKKHIGYSEKDGAWIIAE